MKLEDGVSVSLFYADGTEISAIPFREGPADKVLTGLTTDDGTMIRFLDEEAGEFFEVESGKRLYVTNPMGDTA